MPKIKTSITLDVLQFTDHLDLYQYIGGLVVGFVTLPFAIVQQSIELSGEGNQPRTILPSVIDSKHHLGGVSA